MVFRPHLSWDAYLLASQFCGIAVPFKRVLLIPSLLLSSTVALAFQSPATVFSAPREVWLKIGFEGRVLSI